MNFHSAAVLGYAFNKPFCEVSTKSDLSSAYNAISMLYCNYDPLYIYIYLYIRARNCWNS